MGSLPRSRLPGCLVPLFLAVACAGDPSSSEDGSGDTGAGTHGADTSTASDDEGSDTDAGEDGSTGDPSGLCEDDPPGLVRPEGWGLLSHCRGVAPDYDRLFDSTIVHRFDITMSATDHQAMLDDLEDMYGGGGGPGPGGFPDRDPIYVPVTVDFDGLRWWEVGMRYKGNSSLRTAYQMGARKLAFRFNFDKYEDENPELLDQRFWGFEKMTFSNGFLDPSLIRDKTAGDVFRAAGVPVARSAFARIYVDYGQGPVYFGLYTMIEDPSNKMPETQFSDGSGNLYKPDGEGARLLSFIEADMVKKTNEAAADFGDVQSFIAILSSGSGEAWRNELEGVFDVGGFLTYLALNQTMVNWDSYGWMTHNYYLYADPSDGGRIKWIPWDLNEAMLIKNAGPPGGAPPDSVLLDEIGSEWPLIRRLLDDATYAQAYRDELAAGLAGAFDADDVKAMMQAYHDLIAPYVSGPEGEVAPYTLLASQAEFDTSLTSGQNALFPHVDARRTAVQQALP